MTIIFFVDRETNLKLNNSLNRELFTSYTSTLFVIISPCLVTYLSSFTVWKLQSTNLLILLLVPSLQITLHIITEIDDGFTIRLIPYVLNKSEIYIYVRLNGKVMIFSVTYQIPCTYLACELLLLLLLIKW